MYGRSMKLRKIVVGVDGTTLGAHAWRVAGTLAHAVGAEVTALTVVEGLGSRPQAGDPRHRIRHGAPAIEIPRFAEQEGADLIVLGRCPIAPTALRRTGTVTEGVLRRARVPVLIVPEGHPVGRALVAVAADSDSTDVLAAGLAVVEALGAELHIVQVEPEYALVAATAAADVAAPSGRRLLVRHGDPAREILAATGAERADLLVIGRRRGGTAVDRDGGSIGARVLAQARCAVLVVPV